MSRILTGTERQCRIELLAEELATLRRQRHSAVLALGPADYARAIQALICPLDGSPLKASKSLFSTLTEYDCRCGLMFNQNRLLYSGFTS